MPVSRPSKRNGIGGMLLWTTCLLLAGHEPAEAQWPPEEFTNLEILSKDIGRRELIATMRGFAIGLGVRCEFCHVGEPGQPLSSFDFAADDKPTKLKAREMLRMVRTINEQHLGSLEGRSDPPVEVACQTCHHGQSKPRTLQTVILEAHAEGGLDGAATKYRDLREEFYGSWTFNFTDIPLIEVAQQINAAGMQDDAVGVLRLNLDFYPESAPTHFALGEALLAMGDTTAAVGSYKKSLELEPNNRAARRRLSELGHTP